MSGRRDIYSSDAGLQHKDVEYWLRTCLDNMQHVPANKIKFLENCELLFDEDRPFKPWELSDLEHLYELVIARATNTDALKKHVDRKKKGLRF